MLGCSSCDGGNLNKVPSVNSLINIGLGQFKYRTSSTVSDYAILKRIKNGCSECKRYTVTAVGTNLAMPQACSWLTSVTNQGSCRLNTHLHASQD